MTRYRPSWAALRTIFSETRADWDSSVPDLDPVAAVLAAETAGVPFEKALREALRLLLAEDGTPGELRDFAARHARSAAFSGPGLTREERAELRAAAVGACEAASERARARETGPQPRLREPGRDP